MLFSKSKNIKQKTKGAMPKKSVYALTFGYVHSKKRLNRVVSTRYVLEG